jgi:hypothetical protein
MNWIKKLNRIVMMTSLGIILGAVAGYLYYLFYGCEGSCAITSSPFNSSLYGSMMGALLLNSFSKEKSKST